MTLKSENSDIIIPFQFIGVEKKKKKKSNSFLHNIHTMND